MKSFKCKRSVKWNEIDRGVEKNKRGTCIF